MRSLIFSSRCIKELLRDPLSWIFCLVFPLAMLGIMTLLSESIPAEAGTVIFRIDYLAGGIAVFALTFVMLFAALLLARDRCTSFLTRLFITPMRAAESLLGYCLPLLLIAAVQIAVTYAASLFIAALTDTALAAADLLLSFVSLIPVMLLFIFSGLLFGSLFSDKAAPGVASIFISASSILGGIWMDVDAIGGTLADVCRVLPFYHAVRLGRAALLGIPAEEVLLSLLTVCTYAAVTAAAACFVFHRRMTLP